MGPSKADLATDNLAAYKIAIEPKLLIYHMTILQMENILSLIPVVQIKGTLSIPAVETHLKLFGKGGIAILVCNVDLYKSGGKSATTASSNYPV